MQNGKIVSINIARKKGEKKIPVHRGLLIKNFGIEWDSHAEKDSLRQVSLLDESSVEKMKAKGLTSVAYGSFAENLTVAGLDLFEIKIGTLVEIGANAVIEITVIGKECHSRCEIYAQIGDCIMPKEGIFAKVIEGGEISVGDEIKVKKAGLSR